MCLITVPMPYIQQWHLSVQHQFNNSTMLELAYVGVHGVKLADPSDFDQVPESAIQQVIRPAESGVET